MPHIVQHTIIFLYLINTVISGIEANLKGDDT